MELRQLKYFAGVAEALHFGQAAKKLFVTQSALSQQIKLLELELGAELFVGIKRTKWHKVELTEAGAAFLIDARKILRLSEKAIQNFQQAAAKQQVITLGVFKFILPERIMGMLELFSTRFPIIDIKLVELANTVEVQEWVASDRIDLGLTVLPLVCKGISAIPYAQADYTILMNRNHPLASQKGVRLAQMQHEKWIDFGQAAGVFFVQVEEICRLANIDRSGSKVKHVPSFDLVKSMVRLGKGIAFIPATLDLKQEPGLMSMPIVNTDGTPFKQVVIRHTLIQRCDQTNPLVQALSGLVESTYPIISDTDCR